MEGDRLIGKDTGKDEDAEAKPRETLGLTTTVALDTLNRHVKCVLQEYEEDHRRNKKYRAWLKDALHHRSQYTALCWTSAIALLINAIILIIAYFTLNETWYSTLPYEGLIVCCSVILNFILMILDNKLRHEEIPHRVKILLDQLNVACSTCQWRTENYPHLCSPQSPCLTLQWTYHDGVVVNLPWALLVAGDIIVMKPGQQAPGYCVPYNDSEAPVLHARETYSAPVHSANKIFSTPQAYPVTNMDISANRSPGTCVICLCARADQLVRPCNHLCLCTDCLDTANNDVEYKKLNVCPICRGEISEIEKIYFE